MASTYSLQLKIPVLVGDGFVYNLTARGKDWTRSIRSQGGYWLGSCTVSGSIGELSTFFSEWLGSHVEERSGGVTTWEGLIYELELSHAGVKRRRSLDPMSNYVSMYYVDPARVEYQTPWSSAPKCIARYGRKEMIDWLDDMTQPAAIAQRNRVLAENAWPSARPLSISKPGATELSIVACGYAFTSNWRYTTQNTEFDTEQGALTYAATTFTDAGQNFSDWDTAAPGTAQHSIWVTNDDRTMSWAYIGDLNGGNTRVDIYTDQGLTAAGWNGTDPIAGGQTPVSYYVRGGASALIGDIVTNDCEYLSTGSIDDNYVQVNRILQRDQRAWDVMMDVVDLGDTSGNPYRLYVQNGRRVMYEAIDTEPRYYLRAGSLYDSIGSRMAANPRMMQPAVIRDFSYKAGLEYGSWLADRRDIYVDEVEVDQDDNLTLKTDLYSEGDLLAELAKQQSKYPSRPIPEKGR